MIIFENGHTQLYRHADGSLIVLAGGRDWCYPKTLAEGIEKMLKRDWDETIAAIAATIAETESVAEDMIP